LRAGRALDDAARSHTGAVVSLRFGPDGKTLVSLDTNLSFLEWDLATAQSRAWAFDGPVGLTKGYAAWRSFTLSPTGKVAAVFRRSSQKEGSVYLCDVVTGRVLHVLADITGGFHGFSPDGKTVATGGVGITKTVATGGAAGGIKVWDVATGKPLPHPPLPGGLHHAWSGDGKLLAVAGRGRKWPETVIHLCEVQTGKEIRLLEPTADVRSARIALSPDGRSLACFGAAELEVFDTKSGKARVFTTKAPHKARWTAEFSPSGRYLAFSLGPRIQLWEVGSGQLAREFHAGLLVNALRFSADGRALATGSEDGTILLWDLTAAPQGTGVRKAPPP
jgi:WD40 repeat protein